MTLEQSMTQEGHHWNSLYLYRSRETEGRGRASQKGLPIHQCFSGFCDGSDSTGYILAELRVQGLTRVWPFVPLKFPRISFKTKGSGSSIIIICLMPVFLASFEDYPRKRNYWVSRKNWPSRGQQSDISMLCSFLCPWIILESSAVNHVLPSS